MAFYIAAALEQGAKLPELAGTIQNDILKEFMVRNTYIYPPLPSMRIIADIFAYCAKNMPKFNCISISGYHMQEAGATADLELAYTLADGLEYLRTGVKAGIDIDAFAPRLSFFWAVGKNFFMEIAKMRAARVLWSEMVAQFNPKNPKSLALRTHSQTSGWSLTRPGSVQQRRPHLPRGAGRGRRPDAVAAYQLARRGDGAAHRFLGPHRPEYPAVSPAGDRDLPYRRSLGRLLLRRIPHGCAPQEGAPASGRGRGAWRMAKAIETGLPKMRIEEAAARRQAAIDSGKETIIGVNKSVLEHEAPMDILEVDNTAVRVAQVQRLTELKASRDTAAVQRALEAITAAARDGSGNLLDLAVTAAQARATLGEISDAMEAVFGRHQAVIRTIAGVYRSEFGASPEIEEVRALTDAFAAAKAAGPGSTSPNWDRTDTTAAPRSSPPRMRILDSTSTSGRCSRPRRRRPARRSRTTCTSWA